MLRRQRCSFCPPETKLTSCFPVFEDVTLIPKNLGVKAVDVESLNALLVGVRRVDRCLTEESHSSNI